MEYFRGLTSFVSTPQPESQKSPADMVEILKDRVESSSLLESRRDACRALRGLSRKYRVEVGAKCLDTLIGVLGGAQDHEITSYVVDPETASDVLETLYNVTSPEVFDEEASHTSAVGVQFTEMFLKRATNVGAVIKLLDEYDPRVRLPAIRLLVNLLVNKPKEMQDIVLENPMGISKLMEILSDDIDFVRNEALLLLTQLTKSNVNIQLNVVYQNGFDKLFQVIQVEGYSDGGIVVYDCLQLMLNLLKGNYLNQTFFNEGMYIKRITPFFEPCLQADNEAPGLGWSAQKISNVHSMLQVVRAMVSPTNASQVVAVAQNAIATYDRSRQKPGLLMMLCDLLMTGGVRADILSETICTVAEMIRGCKPNQDFFMQVMAPSSLPSPPSRTALVALLMSMVKEKQPLNLRSAVLYCLQCYLFKNENGQARIVQSLLPTSADNPVVITPGQLLCMGLFAPDSLSHWLSSVSLSHVLVNNVNNKELLLKVHLATSPNSPAISLLQQSFSILQMSTKVQSQLGILIFLSTWLANCPNAVSQFVGLPKVVDYLTQQVVSGEDVIVQSLCAFLLGLCVLFNNDSNSNFTKESLCHRIKRAISVEIFLGKLSEVSKHEFYSKGLQHPQMQIGSPDEVQLDHEFCRLYKSLESQLEKAIVPPSSGGAEGAEQPSESELKAVAKYKEVIREQDDQIQHLRQRLAALDAQYIATQSQMDELATTVQDLQDQNALLKAQRNNNVLIDEVPAAEGAARDIDKLESEMEHLRLDNERLRSQLESKEKHILSLNEGDANPDLVRSNLTNTTSNSILDSFQITGSAKHEEFQVCSLFRPEASNTQLANLQEELKTLRQELQSLQNEKESEKTTLMNELSASRQQCAAVAAKFEKSRKDQEDLLILLTEQDSKILKYKDLLRKHGEMVSDDDDDIQEGDNDGDGDVGGDSDIEDLN